MKGIWAGLGKIERVCFDLCGEARLHVLVFHLHLESHVRSVRSVVGGYM
jgi:hypothetical protein